MNVNVDLPSVFNNLNSENYDADIINKLLKLGELYLTRDPDAAVKFDKKKFVEILQWL